MPIMVSCPGCSTQLKAPDNAAGRQIQCPKCQTAIMVPAAQGAPGVAPQAPPPVAEQGGGGVPGEGPSKIVVGLMGILFGGYGVHKFMLGYKKAGLIQLLVTLTCCGALVMGPIGLIEGIIYLTKSDEDFYQTYVANQKEWF